METRTLKIDGMSCGHCVARVTKALSALPGVTVERVEVGSARVTLAWDATPVAEIGRVLDELGFSLVTQPGVVN